MMFESLTSIMANNPLLSPTLLGRGGVRPGKQNSVLAAVDISFFSDVDGYGTHIDELVQGLKALPRADGVDEIMMLLELTPADLEGPVRRTNVVWEIT